VSELKTAFKIVLMIFIAMVVMRSCQNEPLPSSQQLSATQSDPLQSAPSKKAFSFKDYTITPLADFEITAKVLSSERYYIGRESNLSPIDLALGWGRMADDEVIKAINISQSGRWYHWEAHDLPIPRREIETHSANMHMIPRDDRIKSILLRAEKGDIITIKGALVRIDAKGGGWHWESSLSRNDTGGGACEVIFVEDAQIEYFED